MTVHFQGPGEPSYLNIDKSLPNRLAVEYILTKAGKYTVLIELS